MDSNNKSTLSKIATIPVILEAATILYETGLSTELPFEVVKRYVNANPDINELLQKPDVMSLLSTPVSDLAPDEQKDTSKKEKQRVGIGQGFERKRPYT